MMKIINMKVGENKKVAFKRLANKRANRILKDIGLLGNLSNRNNYSYTEEEIRSIFGALEDEMHLAKSRFTVALKKGRKINL